MAQAITRSVDVRPWHLDVLLVQPPSSERAEVVALLEGLNHRVRAVDDAASAVAVAHQQPLDVIITDVTAAGIDGFALLEQLRSARPEIHFLLVAESPSTDDALAATKARADYLVAPLSARNLMGPIATIARRREQRAEHFETDDGGDPLVGGSPLIKALKRDTKQIAQTDDPVLIVGERGTGKSLLARMIHTDSARAAGPFLVLDCADVDASLRALADPGFLRDAADGTVVLEQIDRLDPLAQTRLLHALAGGPLGTARVLATTESDADSLVTSGRLRPDLRARLDAHRIELPPLRRRRDDLPLLVGYFSHKHGPAHGEPRFAPEVWAALAAFDYPGNVRQLEDVIEHALGACGQGDVRLEHLPGELVDVAALPAPAPEPDGEVVPLSAALTTFEHHYLCQTLARAGGNRTRAAALLGISRKSLWAKLKRYEERRPLLTVGWNK